MELGLLKTVGQICGIAGLSIGMVILIFRDVIRKKIFPKLSSREAFSLLRLIVILVWTIALAGIGAWVYTNHRSENKLPKRPVTGLINAARLQRDTGDYEQSWKLLQEALTLQPESREVRQEQVQLAMAWLRNIHALAPHTLTEYVNQILPCLYEGIAREKGTLAADIHAHIGWANFLKFDEGDRHLEIEGQYKKAISLEPDNPYAHVMWGHWILSQRGKLADAKEHFRAALKTGREKAYVRDLQFAALKRPERAEENAEIIRVSNEMRKNNEELPLEKRTDFVKRVYEWRHADIWEQLPTILPPAEHLATFNWLTDGIEIEPYSHAALFRARLTEEIGDYVKALALYMACTSSPEAKAGIARCKQRAPQAKTELQLLNEAARDADPKVRERAIINLSQLEAPPAERMRTLFAAVTDQNRDVREAAAQGLIGIGAPAVPGLIQMLASQEPRDTRNAAKLLGKIGDDAKAAIPELIKLLKHENDGVRSDTITALGEMGAEAKSAVPALIDVLQHDAEDNLRGLAAYTLGEIGPDAKDAVPALIERLKNTKADGDGFRGSIAAGALGKIGPAAKAAIPALIEGLEQYDRLRVPLACVEALAQMGAEAKAAIPALIEAMQSVAKDYKADRGEAIGLIAQDLMAKGDTTSIPSLRKALRAMEDANLESKVIAPVREALDSLRDKMASK